MFTSGILDKTKLFSNFLLVVLLAGNIYFSIQFINNIQQPVRDEQSNITQHLRATRFLKNFINTVLDKKGEVSFEDRVQLENDMLQMHDPVIKSIWDDFVGSKTAEEGQINAVKLMSLLVDRI
jgi:hypothetical protein